MYKISVIVPIYNVENYLEDSIKSILASTLNDIEVILVDDGSTDKSSEICDKFCIQDPRCKVIHKENNGLSAARNSGLSIATGEFISFIDGDDFIHSQMLEFLYQVLIMHPECALSMCNFSYIHNKREDIKEDSYNLENIETKIISQDYYASQLFGSTNNNLKYVVVWNKLYRKSILKDVVFKESITEDANFNSDILHRIKRIALIEKELHYWVQRPSSLSHKELNKKYIDRLDVYNECLNSIKNNCPQFTHYVLIKIFKTMLSLKYAAKHTEYKKYTSTKIVYYQKLHFKDFMSCKNIPLKIRFSIYTFLKLPFIYNLYRMYMEYRHH